MADLFVFVGNNAAGYPEYGRVRSGKILLSPTYSEAAIRFLRGLIVRRDYRGRWQRVAPAPTPALPPGANDDDAWSHPYSEWAYP